MFGRSVCSWVQSGFELDEPDHITYKFNVSGKKTKKKSLISVLAAPRVAKRLVGLEEEEEEERKEK